MDASWVAYGSEEVVSDSVYVASGRYCIVYVCDSGCL